MNPTRLRECLDELGFSQRQLARLLDYPEGVVRQWARGAVEVPACVGEWLEDEIASLAWVREELRKGE